MEISVIICTYNRQQTIGECLMCLAQQTLAADRFEIVFVNNNSTDDTEKIARHFEDTHPHIRMRYFLETQQGLSFARNTGIEKADGDILVFLDDDAFAFPDYLQQMVTFFQQTDAAGGGGRIYPRFESKRPRWMSSFLLPLTSTIDLGDEPRLFAKRKFPIGANMAVRRTIFQQYGDFNVALGRRGNNMEGAEEKDLFYRLMQGGEKIYYIPDAKVFHFVPDRRLTFSFFKRQSLGLGFSERMRCRNLGTAEFFRSLCREAFKWGVSLILFFYYLLRLQPAAAWRLLVFRYYVTKGLFIRKIS